MRKAQKRQAEEFLQVLGQAHSGLKKLVEKNQIADACQILEDCQQGSIELGNRIEQSEGEGFVTVLLLEEYCESVYRLYEQLAEDAANREILNEDVSNYEILNREISNKEISNKGISVDRMIAGLCRQLEQIKTSLDEDISVRKEAVFLPYNASMWDSLESVWKAAAADPSCDAYVVPIPYYDKNPDGTFGKMHYEGKQLPGYVPIVSWNDYDLWQRRPDMVFIHNPYDDGNIVTSVLPDYYANELKKHTPNLVYIPYFLFVNSLVNENMVITKGVFYADYVIVQSEECCRECIRIYDEYRENNGLQKTFKAGKDKFLPLGSPIIDSTSGDADWEHVPPDWKQKIWQKNHRKKVIFYNTHLSDIMYVNAVRFFKKIREVLEIFKRQTDVVLLWRPHPLTWQTIQAMNPAAAEQYQRLVDDYRAQGWGLYDDTSDLKRSVCISDAYYGDWSSVVTMFREAGKPVMMQNMDILYD